MNEEWSHLYEIILWFLATISTQLARQSGLFASAANSFIVSHDCWPPVAVTRTDYNWQTAEFVALRIRELSIFNARHVHARIIGLLYANRHDALEFLPEDRTITSGMIITSELRRTSSRMNDTRKRCAQVALIRVRYGYLNSDRRRFWELAAINVSKITRKLLKYRDLSRIV